MRTFTLIPNIYIFKILTIWVKVWKKLPKMVQMTKMVLKVSSTCFKRVQLVPNLAKSSHMVSRTTLVQSLRRLEFLSYVCRLYYEPKRGKWETDMGRNLVTTQTHLPCWRCADDTHFRWDEKLNISASIKLNWMISTSNHISFSWDAIMNYVAITYVERGETSPSCQSKSAFSTSRN